MSYNSTGPRSGTLNRRFSYLIEKFVRPRCWSWRFFPARCEAEMGDSASIQGHELDVRTSIGTANATTTKTSAPGPLVHLLAGA